MTQDVLSSGNSTN